MGQHVLDENHTLDAETLVASGNAGGTLFGLALAMSSDGLISDSYTQLYTDKAGTVCLYLAASTDNRRQAGRYCTSIC